MSTTVKFENVVNNPHALTWAVIGWLAKPNTFVYWSTRWHTAAAQAQEKVVEALMSVNLDIRRVLRTSGNEDISLENGSLVKFRARVSLSGRGVSADKLILDEAYALTDFERGALLPVAFSQRAEIVYAQTEDPRDNLVYHNNTGCPGHEDSQFKGGAACPKK